MYTVIIEHPAEEEAERAYLHINEQAPLNAERWWNGLVDAILSLEEMPKRCPLAREDARFDEDIRQLVYKSHRILFTLRGDRVHILHIRHSAMSDVEP